MTEPEQTIDVSHLNVEDYEKNLPPMKIILRRYEINNGIAELHDYIFDIISYETNEKLTYENGIHCANITIKMREKF